MSTILGVDPGLANFGLVAVSDDKRILCASVFRSENAKTKIPTWLDTSNRARNLYRWLDDYFCGYGPVCVCAEAFSFVRHAPSAVKLGFAWGVLLSLCVQHEVPLAQVPPQDIKRAMCGKANASKKDVTKAVTEAYGFTDWPEPPGIAEHAADAAGAVWALWNDDIVMAARR